MEKIIMFGYAMLLAANMYGCSLVMTPSKTSVKVSNTVSSVDKANSDKDQTKNSMTVSVTQDFKWDKE
tara:strand:- start:599 stop:802 length:204 start_codon:yes stop_codon:yes gene_type:complete